MSHGLDRLLQRCMAEGVPGSVAVVVDSNGTIDQAATGRRRVDASDPITLSDRFHLGSNAKAMVATAVACLVEDGRLAWDTTIETVLPGTEIRRHHRSTTIEMLLRHSAGLPPYTDDEADDFVVPTSADPSGLDVTTFARFVLSRQPLYEPGETFSYSNAGYSVVAAILEAVTGSPWMTVVRDRVFDRLGIDGAVGRSWPALDDPHQPWGHLMEGGSAVPHPPNGPYQLEPFLAPAGDVSMSMPNYGRFLQAHLAGLAGMDTLVNARNARHLHNDGEIGTGLGWGVTRLRSLEHLGIFSTHAGSAGTFVVAAAVSHQHDRAFALALNAGLETHLGDWLRTMVRIHLER